MQNWRLSGWNGGVKSARAYRDASMGKKSVIRFAIFAGIIEIKSREL